MQDASALDWLLEEDHRSPSVRYFGLRDLLGRPESDPQVQAARAAIMQSGPVPRILEAQEPYGAWVMPGGGYSPKYRANAWSLLFLAELGADQHEARIQAACEYYLTHSAASNGAFSVYRKPVQDGCFYCLNGNMIFALQRLGYGDDPRLQAVRLWLARSILGREKLPNPSSAAAGPGFICRINEDQPCAWGANKSLRALLESPRAARNSLIERALQAGADFLLSRDPAIADYPYSGRVSPTWFKLGFPLSYWSDVLETVSNLVLLGYGQDARLKAGLDWILAKQDQSGRWKLENSLNGKMWVDIEKRGRPSKWVTLRTLKVLRDAGLYSPAV